MSFARTGRLAQRRSPWAATVEYIRDLAAHVKGGDFGIRKAIQLAYGLEEMPTPDGVVEIGERWRPNRSLASIYLWESLAGDVTVGGV